VTRPLSYARHKNSRRVLITIVTTWIISAFVSSPIVLGINYTDRRLEHPSLCTFYNADFLIYSSMASFYVPCVIMTVLYGRIFVAIRRRERKNKALVPSSSSAAARRLSCAGGGPSSTLCPPPVSVPTPAVVPRPLCALEEATVDRLRSSVVVDAPASPPASIRNDVVMVTNDAVDEQPVDNDHETMQLHRPVACQPALPILLLPSGEAPRTDDSFGCEGDDDRVLAMLPTPYVPATIVRLSPAFTTC